MGKAIIIPRLNFTSSPLGVITPLNFDISWCKLYRYLIGNVNSYIDLGFKAPAACMKEVNAKAMGESSTHNIVFGNARYISSSQVNLHAIMFRGSSVTNPSIWTCGWTSSNLYTLTNAQKPYVGYDCTIYCYNNGSTDRVILKKRTDTIFDISGTTDVANMTEQYNSFLMAGYNNTDFMVCNNNIYVSSIKYSDADHDKGYHPDGWGLWFLPCQLIQDIDASKAFDGAKHSAGECGFVEVLSTGLFYGSTSGTLGFTVSNQ